MKDRQLPPAIPAESMVGRMYWMLAEYVDNESDFGPDDMCMECSADRSCSDQRFCDVEGCFFVRVRALLDDISLGGDFGADLVMIAHVYSAVKKFKSKSLSPDKVLDVMSGVALACTSVDDRKGRQCPR